VFGERAAMVRCAASQAGETVLARIRWLGVVALLCCAQPQDASSTSQPLRISVIGGSGMIGQRVVQEALNRGHHVTMIVRDAAKVTRTHERLTVAQGDVLDSPGIAKVVRGQDVVVSAVGTARAENPDYTLYLQAAKSLVDALRSLGNEAPRLIVVGGVGSLTDKSGKLLYERAPVERQPEHLGQKAALDFYRNVPGVRWTYVSPPGSIAPGERTGVYRTSDDEILVNDKGESKITMEDYAVALIDEAENPRHVGKRFTVGY
jgi:putative NADH-flavin reductase